MKEYERDGHRRKPTSIKCGCPRPLLSHIRWVWNSVLGKEKFSASVIPQGLAILNRDKFCLP